MLGPVLFNIFVNDLHIGLKGTLNKFSKITKLEEAVDSLEGTEAFLAERS